MKNPAGEPELRERLNQHVFMLAEAIGPRCTTRPQNLQGARDYLRQCVEALGLAVTEHRFETFDREGVNLAVTLPGTKPQRPALVVGAHYDTVPSTPGADDNASAVAILLETLRYLVDRPRRRTVHGVFYDTEEPPYFGIGEMGSRHDARTRRLAGEKLLGMICLESLGYFTDRPPVPQGLPTWQQRLLRLIGGRSIVAAANPPSARLLAKLLPRMCSWRGVPIRPVVVPRSVHVINLSDHRSYWDEGFPAVMLTDTALLRNSNYHEPTDRLETLDLSAMTRLCRQISRGVAGLCR